MQPLYGPKCRHDMLPYRVFNSILNDIEFTKYGDGDAIRDWLYVEDAVDAIFKIINQNKDFDIFNIGTGEPKSFKDIASLVFKFWNKEKKITYSNKELNSFLYVSNGSKHKNHKRLFMAFIKAANKTSSVIKLNLTLSNNEFVNSPYSKITAPKNLKILNHGILEFSKLEKVYKKTQFLIFPSLNESFGLPLIESINYNCKVLAPNLDYVNEVIMPSIKFDPFSVSSLSESIILAITKNNIKHSKIIVENKIDTFVKYISNNV